MKQYHHHLAGWLAAVALLLGLTAPAQIKQESGAASSNPARRSQPHTVTLNLPPAGESDPAFAARLFPVLPERKPGNAVQYYYRAVGLLPANFQETISPKLDQWLGTNVAALPTQEVREVLDKLKGSLHEVANGARRDACHWDMPLEEGFGMMLPGLSQFRSLARALVLQARLQAADGHFTDALTELQSGFSLAYSMGEGPTLIQGLVGVAIGKLMLQEVEQLIQQPGVPNLYWALTLLPQPLVDLRHAMELESQFLDLQFPRLRELPTTVLSADEARRLIASMWLQLQGNGGMDALSSSLDAPSLFYTLMVYPQAKLALLNQGYDPQYLARLPAAQVTLIYAVQQHLHYSQNLFKWFYVPFPQAADHLRQFDQNFTKQFNTLNKKLIGFPAMYLLPALPRACSRVAQLDRDLAALRCVEAIRIYAANHQGKLPDSLKDITSVPVPVNPATGKDFDYHVEAGQGFLEAEPLPADSAGRGLHYLIKLNSVSTR